MGGGPSKAEEFCKVEEFCKDLKTGDLIEFRHNPSAFSHWAVYVGVQSRKHSIIHLVLPSLQREKHSCNKSNTNATGPYALDILTKKKFQYSARISMDPLEEVPDFQCNCARVNNDDDQRHKPLSEYKIMAAALGKVGDTIEFHAIANNCEHFAKSCRYGLKLSGQSLLLVLGQYELIQELCKTDKCLNDYVQSIIPSSTKTENIDKNTNINTAEEKLSFSKEDVKSTVVDCSKQNFEAKSEVPVESTSKDTKDSTGDGTAISDIEKLELQKSISDDLELKDRNLRKYNIIIFGLPDAGDIVTWVDNVLIIQKLLEDLDLVKVLNIPKNIVDIKRFGKYDPSRKRALRLKFNTIENRDLFFQTANVLIKQLPDYANVSVRYDLTKKQLEKMPKHY